MESLDLTTRTYEQLTSMLHAWALGSYAEESAVNLLAGHGTWLARRDFITACVGADDGWGGNGMILMAFMDWDAAAQFASTAPASSSEILILRLACSFAGVETGTLHELTDRDLTGPVPAHRPDPPAVGAPRRRHRRDRTRCAGCSTWAMTGSGSSSPGCSPR